MKKEKEKVALPKSAKEKAQTLFVASMQAQDKLRTYIQGCKDALNLDGDWNLNTRTWEFESMPKEDK